MYPHYFRKLLHIGIAIVSLFLVTLQLSLASQLEEFKANTQALLHLLNPLQSGKNLQQAQLQELTILISARHALLTNQQQLAQYYNYLLPTSVTRRLPQALQTNIEKEVTNITGVLEIRAELAKQRRDHEAIHYLLRSNGQTYDLKWATPAALTLKTGDTIEIKKAFVIQETTNRLLLLVHPDYIKVIKRQTETAIPDAFGPQTTIAILVNFNDAPNNRPWTTTEVKDVFQSVNNQFYEASYKQTTVVTDVVGWYVIALNSNTNCDTLVDQVATLAKAAATKAGVDLSKYKRHVFMFPEVSQCGFAGLGTIGGSPSASWLNGYNNTHVTAHELGHNITLFHSHALKCVGSPNQGSCTRDEYGDVVDVMGIGWLAPHFNAFQKEHLGWLAYQSSPPIQTVTANGTYVIDPYETVSAKPKALKVLKQQNTGNGSSDYYYLEFRQPIGFDADLNCNGCDYVKGVVFHQANNQDDDSVDMLDMSPSNDNKLVALTPGQSFKDANAPNGGVTFTVKSVGVTGAVVDVNFGSAPPPTCTRANPTVTMNPTTTQWVTAGGNANWVVTIKNNDSSQCPRTAFTLKTKKPSLCMRPVLNKPFVMLDPGTSTTVTLNIATASWLDPAVHEIYVIATNKTDVNFMGQGTASLGITASTAFTQTNRACE